MKKILLLLVLVLTVSACSKDHTHELVCDDTYDVDGTYLGEDCYLEVYD